MDKNLTASKQDNPALFEQQSKPMTDGRAIKLVPLAEHNKIRLNSYKEDKKGTGIACPECGEELFTIKDLMLTNPPKQFVKCPNCNHEDTIIV